MSGPKTMALVLVKLNIFCVVERRKNHLGILEGHLSNKEMKATDKPIPAGKG